MKTSGTQRAERAPIADTKGVFQQPRVNASVIVAQTSADFIALVQSDKKQGQGIKNGQALQVTGVSLSGEYWRAQYYE